MKKFFGFLFVFTLAISGYAQVKELFTPLSKIEANGNLFTTKQNDLINSFKKEPWFIAQYLVRLNLDNLKAGEADSISITLPGSKSVVYKKRRLFKFKEGYSWGGTLSYHASGDSDFFRADFRIIDNQLSGEFMTDWENEYKIFPLGNGINVINKIDQSKIPKLLSPKDYVEDTKF